MLINGIETVAAVACVVALGAAAAQAQGPSAPADKVRLAVDVGKAGAEISPLVYGQFIEHLGRCIRDGIWAEKLRDRKFLLEMGKSPWQPVRGGAAAATQPAAPAGNGKPVAAAATDVALDPAGAYGGSHGLALWAREGKEGPCGVSQGGIGLLKDKEYVGYAVLACPAEPVGVRVRISWGAGDGDGISFPIVGVAATYKKFPFRFRAGATTDDARIALTVDKGLLWAACLSLMPADNVRGMRRDTLDLLRRLNAPIYRWPGGNFVSGYNWKDGIGDRDRRPARWERAWNDVEDNDFGIDEFLDFCREIKTQPLIVVNTGLGGFDEAAQEVEYVSGPAGSRWGGERARNGHAEPYNVTWWGIGNEMYGGWQLGNVSVERYVLRHNAFVQAMRAVDGRIRVVAVGAGGKWNDLIVPGCAAHADLLSMHHYSERKLRVPLSPADLQTYRKNFPAYSASIAQAVRGMVADLRKRQDGKDPAVSKLKLAIDEYGIVRNWNPAPDAAGVGSFEHYYTVGDTVTVARGLNEMLRNADVIGMANWPQTVNVIGAIKTTRNHACMDAVGHLLTLYRARLGGQTVRLDAPADTPLDAAAAWDAQAGLLSLTLVNSSLDRELDVTVQPAGLPSGGPAAAEGWQIAGDLEAFNTPGQDERVTVKPLGALSLEGPIRLPPHSITVVQVRSGPSR
jgi:alpha-L-arabinofuranosidase